ncbi:MAG: 2-succinyl-6-hydroxy-2,4-cyclohexadiene-1-carboxylate synthase [Melioribacteraceae bacterium]|jgi:2-succinyl-6-hydroxy-2,4-cyclohexadiene-1-carboxylate synthase|nr:2-succinyl-6-hydroxy-2,4-cyclohexadiene-1-carboxylate synthase [Melioribacteraceae bacterium]
MEISSNGINVNVVCSNNFVASNKIPIIFLHGFTGSAENWLSFFEKLDSKYFPIAIDLPGHGKTNVPDNLDSFSANSHIETVDIVLNHFQIQKAILVGYSMGGRTALSFAVINPGRIIALVLESATAGIEEATERKSRIKTDFEIADKILSDGIDSFVQDWMDLPFFRSLKSLDDVEYSQIIQQKRTNSATGLVNSLRGFSTGQMPSLWNRLESLKFPTLLIAGSLDRKYVRLNKQMNLSIHNSELKIIEDCGHNTHSENPEEFIILVNEFLNSLD